MYGWLVGLPGGFLLDFRSSFGLGLINLGFIHCHCNFFMHRLYGRLLHLCCRLNLTKSRNKEILHYRMLKKNFIFAFTIFNRRHRWSRK